MANKSLLAVLFLSLGCVYKPVLDERLIPIATDAELVAEYRKLVGGMLVDRLYIDKVNAIQFQLLDELGERWGTDRRATELVIFGHVSKGLPSRAVLVAWGTPLSVESLTSGQVWHYRGLGGEPPRRVEFDSDLVSAFSPSESR